MSEIQIPILVSWSLPRFYENSISQRAAINIVGYICGKVLYLLYYNAESLSSSKEFL